MAATLVGSTMSRYEQHADHPDEIVVRRRGLLLKRRRGFPFSGVETVRPRERTVVLRLDRVTLEARRQPERTRGTQVRCRFCRRVRPTAAPASAFTECEHTSAATCTRTASQGRNR